jgi:hypothetical protein
MERREDCARSISSEHEAPYLSERIVLNNLVSDRSLSIQHIGYSCPFARLVDIYFKVCEVYSGVEVKKVWLKEETYHTYWVFLINAKGLDAVMCGALDKLIFALYDERSRVVKYTTGYDMRLYGMRGGKKPGDDRVYFKMEVNQLTSCVRDL